MKKYLVLCTFFTLLLTTTSFAQSKIDKLIDKAVATKQLDEKMTYLEKAIKLKPNNAKPYYHRGNIAYRSDDFEKAVIDYNKAISLNPNYTDAYYFRGKSQANLGNKAEAEADWEMVKTLEPYWEKYADYMHMLPTPFSWDTAPSPSVDFEEKHDGPITAIEFVEPEFDFGKVNEGEKVQHVYKYTNTGTEPLIISNAKGSCGCTVPKWDKEPLAPGESAEIVVEFNSKNKKGKRNQKVTITANTDPIRTFIYLKGEVEPSVD